MAKKPHGSSTADGGRIGGAARDDSPITLTCMDLLHGPSLADFMPSRKKDGILNEREAGELARAVFDADADSQAVERAVEGLIENVRKGISVSENAWLFADVVDLNGSDKSDTIETPKNPAFVFGVKGSF